MKKRKNTSNKKKSKYKNNNTSYIMNITKFKKPNTASNKIL
jgi:hypothetical protein